MDVYAEKLSNFGGVPYMMEEVFIVCPIFGIFIESQDAKQTEK